MKKILSKIKPSEIKAGQILYANLTVVNKKGERVVCKEQIVAKEYDGTFQTVFKNDVEKDSCYIKKLGMKSDITITELEIITDLGMKNPPIKQGQVW